jgi:nitroimidazol reductase NimA-like FMN-containing flavoprotein (pyridoxamine 5'-phosphate oxidase superfamily)
LYYNKTPEVGPPTQSSTRPPTRLSTRVRRHPERAAYDRDAVYSILDEGLVGHVGLVSDGQPYVMPMLYARVQDSLYLHGSPKSRLLSAVAEGASICVTVTLLDGLVLARSAFHHSLNYRSVVVVGQGRAVRNLEEKQQALRALVDHVLSGRSNHVRGPSEPELKVTEVVALDLRQASAKTRTGPPVDNRADYSLPVWAGELPLGTAIGEPVADEYCTVPEPGGLREYSRARA